MNINGAVVNYYLNVRGVKHSNIGYKYLMSAIMIVAQDPAKFKRITDIYEQVAEMYKTKPSGVERAVRYSIIEQGQTNKEFISKAVYDIIYDFNR